MAKPKETPDARGPGASIQPPAPDPGDHELVSQLADWTEQAPLLGWLGDFSIGHALRFLMWLAAILLCMAGLGLGAAGTALGFVAVGSLSSSISKPLDSAAITLSDASASLSGAGAIGANVTGAAGPLASSLRNLSGGLGATAQTLRALASLPALGAGLGGLNGAAAQIEQSSADMGTAANAISAAGQGSADSLAGLAKVGEDLNTMSGGLQQAKRTAQSALATLQWAVLGLGGALEMMLGGTLLLAIAYGPPKREKKAN